MDSNTLVLNLLVFFEIIPQRRHVELVVNPVTRYSGLKKKQSRSFIPYRSLSATVTRAPLEIIVPRLCCGMKKYVEPPVTKWKSSS